MKKIIILLMLPILLCACGATEKATVENIDCTKMTELVNDGAVLIDVRDASEYQEGHLDGAININYTDIASKIETTVDKKDTKIVVYCKSGRRSSIAAKSLIDLGYTNVYDLGGMSNCKK